MCTWSLISLQDANSPTMEHLTMFHDHTLFINIVITMVVIYTIVTILAGQFWNRRMAQNQNLELMWTLVPIVILFFMAFPSIKILYLMDEIFSPVLTMKCLGHQWYWSYEYSDFNNVEFDAFMIPTETLSTHEFRLLEVNNRTIVPFNNQIRLLVTSLDVIHSWTVPSLGIKIDATPGRINQVFMFLDRPGLYYGQCSEICGANHSFMPISIESVNLPLFIHWIKNF
uniref:Cytochrome c oxidase subunit 2 n=1 Tax=Pachycephus smyrnensis TaxID=1090887 RepID=A0A1W6Q5B9_9HYME|nr:cytochrome c oxidase subunit II [Pachycephus smyrnensis]ARO34946.1 cytochrome c oxidase subunit II [Pachycephus smyrnensis]UTY22574.1 cytochrome c oxidase subunit II [Pachycephus smyrnensis]